jgi:hypothetical protein
MPRNCSVFLPVPQVIPCDNGNCHLDTGICDCAPGWTDRGDLGPSIDEDSLCDVNIAAIQSLYALVLASNALLFIAAVFKLYSSRKNGELRWKHWRRWLWALNQLISVLFLAAFAILKIVDPVTNLVQPSSPTSVVLYSFGSFFTWSWMTQILYIVMKAFAGKHLLLHHSSEELRHFQNFRKIYVWLISLSLFFAISPILLLIPGCPPLVVIVLHIFGLGLSCLLSAIVSAKLLLSLVQKLEDTLSRHGPNYQRLSKLAKRIRFFAYYTPQNFFFNFLICTLFSFWPFLSTTKIS